MKVLGMKALAAGIALLSGLFVGGCSTQAKRVECDWRLKPINPPTAPSVPSAPSKEPKVNNEK